MGMEKVIKTKPKIISQELERAEQLEKEANEIRAKHRRAIYNDIWASLNDAQKALRLMGDENTSIAIRRYMNSINRNEGLCKQDFSVFFESKKTNHSDECRCDRCLEFDEYYDLMWGD